MARRAGERTTDDWRVGRAFDVLPLRLGLHGVCISVTPWGNDQVRWVRLRHPDGTETSYAPSHLRQRRT